MRAYKQLLGELTTFIDQHYYTWIVVHGTLARSLKDLGCGAISHE